MLELASFFDSIDVIYEQNVSFKSLTTYKCGGNALYVCYPKNIELLVALLRHLKANAIDYKVFGNGSNILASDSDYDGVIIKLTKLKNKKIGNDVLTVDAGYNLAVLAYELAGKGYHGLEFACGIPGTVGGAIYMNAGAYLSSMSDVIESVTVLNNKCEIVELSNRQMSFSYRTSILQENKFICLSARIRLKKGDVIEIKNLVEQRRKRRLESQPLEFPSAGSVFRNPLDNYAGKLIEDCNLKGSAYGGAKISDKHANFIINYNNAKSSDIKYLMDLAKNTVKDKFKVDLHIEQELFNWE